MLDAYVIEEIKRRERGQGRDERPAVELPVPAPSMPGPRGQGEEPREDRDDGDRGVVIIDYSA